MKLRAGACVLGLCSLLSGFARAEEQKAGVQLRWLEHAECPTSAQVVDNIQSLLGRPLAALDTHILFEVKLLSTTPWKVTLRAQREGLLSERELVGENCSAVAEAVAVIVALAVDAEFRKQDAAPIEPPAPKETIPPKPPRRVPVRPVFADTSSLSEPGLELSLQLRMTTLVDSGSLPGLAWGGEFDLSLGLGLVLIEARANYWLPKDVLIGDQAQSVFSLWSAGLSGCLDFMKALSGPAERWQLPLCLGMDLGWVSARSQGLLGPGAEVEQGSLWLAGLAELGLSLRLFSQWWLEFRTGAQVALSRPEFLVQPLENPIFQPNLVIPRVRLGLGWRF